MKLHRVYLLERTKLYYLGDSGYVRSTIENCIRTSIIVGSNLKIRLRECTEVLKPEAGINETT